MVSAPSTFTEPERFPTRPMIDFMVVVLPAPLRPTRVTSSPLRTARSTPWRTCDSPYQAWRPFTESSGSAMLRPQVRRDHGGVLGHLLVVALGDDLAAGEHRDPVGEAGDDSEVVLDHQDGPVLGPPLDQARDPVDVLVAHPGGGLVEQHQLRVERQGGGDLQGALAPVRELRRERVAEVAEAHRREQIPGARVEAAQDAVAAPEVEGPAPLALERDAHVLHGGQVREHGADLERADQALAGDVRGRVARDLLALVGDGAAGGRQEAGEQVETSGLARAVGPDQGVDGSALDPEIDALDR